MATLDELQKRLERLREVRAKGHREYEISSGDMTRRMVYRDDRELGAAIADLERQIAAASGRRVDTVVFSTTKGI